MITEQEALEIAMRLFKKKRKADDYRFLGAEFFPERTGSYPAPARWIVRYQKPQPPGGSVDDGDCLFVVSIDPESGASQILKSI